MYKIICNEGDDLDLGENPKKKVHKQEIVEVPEEPEDLQDEDVDESKLIRLRAILKIYMVEFKDKLGDLVKKLRKVDDMGIEELENLQVQVSTILGVGNMYSKMASGFVGALGILEQLSVLTPIKLQGFTEKIRSDQSIMDDIKLVCLDICSTRYVDPKARVLLGLSATAFHTHQLNIAMESIKHQQALQQQAPQHQAPIEIKLADPLESINKDYADL